MAAQPRLAQPKQASLFFDFFGRSRAVICAVRTDIGHGFGQLARLRRP
jgi:hypothetical protein